MTPPIRLPLERRFLARLPDGRLLLHVPGVTPRGLTRMIRLYDGEQRRYVLEPVTGVREETDPARLAEMENALDRHPPRLPGGRTPVRPAAGNGRGIPPAAPPSPERGGHDPEAAAALERYARTASDTACEAGTIRDGGTLVREIVLDPAAQETGGALWLWLPAIDPLGSPEVRRMRDRAELERACEFRPLRGSARQRVLTRYRAWQAIEALPHLLQAFERALPDLRVPSAAILPGIDDVKLALIWSAGKHREVLLDHYRRGSDSPEAFAQTWDDVPRARRARAGAAPGPEQLARSEIERLLSARMAEKAVGWFYADRSPDAKVADVSARQVAEFEAWLRAEPLRRSGCAYHTHDLDVTLPGGETRLLDVKNCRAGWVSAAEHQARSATAAHRPAPGWGRRYRTHTVAEFKTDRARSREVRIAGVFSPFGALKALVRGRYRDGAAAVVLGELDLATMRRLQAQCLERDALVVSFEPEEWNPSGAGFFFPPWMFSVPPEAYPPDRVDPTSAEDRFSAAARRWHRLEPGYWPMFLRACGPDTAPGWVDGLDAPWARFARTLLERPRSARLSLPDLYLAVLGHFLGTVRHAPAHDLASFDPAEYRGFLFGAAPRDQPLGIHDPLHTVDELVESLCCILTGNVEAIAAFDEFRFGHAGVLQGQRGGERWTTLLFPYCGGENCGYEWLALGKDGAQSCEECGHLVCPRPGCRFCGPARKCRNLQSSRQAAAHDG